MDCRPDRRQRWRLPGVPLPRPRHHRPQTSRGRCRGALYSSPLHNLSVKPIRDQRRITGDIAPTVRVIGVAVQDPCNLMRVHLERFTLIRSQRLPLGEQSFTNPRRLLLILAIDQYANLVKITRHCSFDQLRDKRVVGELAVTTAPFGKDFCDLDHYQTSSGPSIIPTILSS